MTDQVAGAAGLAQVVVMAVLLGAQPSALDAQDPVKWRVNLDRGEIAQGDTVVASVSATIDPGWYIYSITQGEGGPVPTSITLPAEQLFERAGSVEGPDPTVKFDENFSMRVEVHELAVSYRIPVVLVANSGAGAVELRINARYQACTDRVCLPAQTERLYVPLTVLGG